MTRAVICRRLGTPEDLALEDLPRAPLGPKQARVEVHAAGINFPDILMVAGTYQHKPDLPFVPGMEAAGIVTELAEPMPGLAVGDRVVVALRTGGYAEEVVADRGQILPLPAGYSFVEGATFRIGYLTAYHALVDRAGLQRGETLLVHGAGGGVGLAAVELGHLFGARVIAAASTAAKLDVARSRGADHLLRYGDEPFQDVVKRLTEGRGADVVFDPVGGSVLESSLRCLAWGARVLVVGFASGAIGQVASNRLLIKGAALLGVRAGEAGRRDPALSARNNAELAALAEGGLIRPHVSHVLPLARWAEAMRLLTAREAIGRVALTVR